MAVKKRKKVTRKKVIKKKPAAKSKPVKKPAAKKSAKKALKKQTAEEKKLKKNIIGKITHYFPKVRAAVIKLKVPLSVGDTIRIKGHTTDFTQTVVSMQIDRVPITTAKKGDEIGLLVNSRVRGHDMAYKP